MQKRTYLTILPDNRTVALRAAGKLANGENALEYDRSQKLWFAKDGADLERIKEWLPENTVAGNTVTVGTDLSPQEEFAKVLEDADFVLTDLPLMDGKLHRVPTKEDSDGKQSGVYRGYLDGRPAGWYQNHRASEGKVNWTSTGSFTWDPNDAIRQKALQAQKRWDRERKELADFDRMGKNLTRQWEKMPAPGNDHRYLLRKGVPATDGVRQDKYGNLVIPLSNTHGNIRSLQYIDPDGKKNLKKDAEKSGNFFVVGGALVPGMPVLYAEGYATAASLNMATGLPVVMTVDAGNMVTVSQKLKEALPGVPHIILGEDDFTRKDNKGLLKAEEAARNIGGVYVIPTFTDSERAQAFAGTASFSDFNDIHASRGLDAVRDQLAPVLDPLIPRWRDSFVQETLSMPDSDKTTTVEEDIYREYLAETQNDALKASPVPEATTAQPVIEQPVPEAPPAQPAVEQPVPEATPVEPAVEQPVPEATPAEPAVEQPMPEATTAQPVIEQPVPEATPAQPAVEQPVPEATPAEPVVEQPMPEATTAQPADELTAPENGFAFTFGRLPGDVSPDTEAPTVARIDLDELLQGLTSRQDGNTWVYALEGKDAFRDYGDRIVMASPEASENDRMILAALLSARANNRGAVEVTGSPEFITKTLTLIADHNIEVHLKNPEQRAQFEALMASRNEQKVPENGMTMTQSEQAPVSDVTPSPSPAAQNAPAQPTAAPSAVPPAAAPVAAETQKPAQPMSVIERETLRAGLTGTLMDAGPAPYQFNEKNTPSYYVTMRTKQGAKTYWGVELEQALIDSGKQPGDLVKLQFKGKTAVTVNVPVKNEDGVVTGFMPHETHRNQWNITPAVNNQLLTDNPDKVAPAQLAAYDGNAFWQIQAQVMQQANLTLATPAAQGHSLLYTGPDGKGQPAPEQAPANTPVPVQSKAAGSLVMQAFDADGQVLAHLVKGHGDYLQGVVRHENELRHVLGRLCTTSDGNRFLALNTVRDDGSLHAIGHASPVNKLKGAEVNYDTFAFQLTGKDAPKFAVPLVSPEKIPPALHSKLGFTQAYTPPKAEEAAPQPRQQAKPAMQHQPM
ncbi:LPD7 domain-containing protein [Buttiauxella agrestis]|uniref:LPD7 domain-containing protein n=1 Tax=Buttiauxella agrestis TaxID=82977 RepID=UPI0039754934